MRQPLTKRQRQILDYISATIDEHGYAPTILEIAVAHQLSSLATVHKHLEALKTKGYIRRGWNRPRFMELIHPSDCCAMCGRPLEKAKDGAAA